jgi:hypothetical protein
MTTDFNVALQNQLSERQRRKDSKGGVERIFSRRQIEQAFLETFEMVGGVPRLAIWANDPANYGQFLALMMKLAPKDAGGAIAGAVLEYRSNVPQSPLNRGPASIDEDVQDV